MSAPMTIVTERLGSSKMSTESETPAPRTGRMPGKVRGRAGSRAKCPAAKSTKENLASSEGWIVTGPSPSQRVAP